MNRRSFLGSLTAFLALILGPFRFVLNKAQAQVSQAVDWAGFWRHSPIQILSASQLQSQEFNGDDAVRTHDVFWDRAGYIKRKGGIPAATEEVDVVIVGGGAAGLAAAYRLRDRRVVVLEQDRFFGGNAKGERFGDSQFPIGAVYTGSPQAGGDLMNLISDLGLAPYTRTENSAHTTVFHQNKFFRGFWQGATDPTARDQFLTIFKELQSWGNDSRKSALLGFQPGLRSSETRRLDSITFSDWLRERFGAVHPHILEYFQLYGWSSFLGSIDELSASQMLGFVSAETGELATFPGGLAALTHGLYAKLYAEIGAANLRASCLAADVRLVDGGMVEVCYDDPDRNLRTIRAKTCIVASPKFIAKHLVQDLPAEQKAAMERIKYRAYVVANVILDTPIASPSFELYCLEGEMPPRPTPRHPSQRAFTDICFSSWVNHDRTGNGVITVYNGMAYDGPRQHLFNPGAHDKHRTRILNALGPLLHSLGKTQANVAGMRMTRWGHALPIAYNGMIASGIAELAHQPVQNRIFFANQDNWVNPCFETSLAEAYRAADTIRSLHFS